MTSSHSCDVLIVGAGIAGIGLAAHLPPKLSVVVLEREERAGYHSTGRSAAILIRNYGNAVIRALTRASARWYNDWEENGFSRPLLTQRGLLYVAGENGRDDHRKLLESADGLNEIDVAAAVAMVPILDRDKIVAAAYEADGQDVDVDLLHQAWIRRMQANGGRLVTKAALASAERAGGRWRVTTPQGAFDARILVDAAGAWADEVARRAGIAPLGLQPMRRSMAVLPAPVGYDIAHWPLTADAAEGYYFKPEAGKLFVSPAEETPVEPHDAFPDDMILAEGLDRFEQAVTIKVERVERSWAGLRTFAQDRTPVAGFDGDGFFWLAGQGGYGIQTAPALSRLAAAIVAGSTLDEEDAALAAALSPARFRG